MKQETINIIKSMTEQGFMVIVDPEKLNDQDGVIIQAMAWKDTDNKAEATLTVEEPKPEIDLLQCDGRRFRAKILCEECNGVITVEDGSVFLCNNVHEGNESIDKKGFKFSWCVDNGSNISLSCNDVTDFELLPEPRVIFTNCVGEVFTEEDESINIEAWYYQADAGLICSAKLLEFNSVEEYAASDDISDIFRSKKSLLRYLYETCE